jgi:hypothetical protein
VNSDVTFSQDFFDILCVFFRRHMEKLMRFYHFSNIFCNKSGNLNLLIFPNSRLHNIQESQKILFFEFSIIFFSILQCQKRRSTGGGDAWGGEKLLRTGAKGFADAANPLQKVPHEPVLMSRLVPWTSRLHEPGRHTDQIVNVYA